MFSSKSENTYKKSFFEKNSFSQFLEIRRMTYLCFDNPAEKFLLKFQKTLIEIPELFLSKYEKNLSHNFFTKVLCTHCSSGHVECSFDSYAGNFALEVQNILRSLSEKFSLTSEKIYRFIKICPENSTQIIPPVN